MGFVFTSLQILEDLKVSIVWGFAWAFGFIIVGCLCTAIVWYLGKSIKGMVDTIREDAATYKTKLDQDKEALNRRLLEVLSSQKEKMQNDVATYSFCVLDKSGFSSFVSKKKNRLVQKKLTQLLTNGNEEAIVAYLKKAVDSL